MKVSVLLPFNLVYLATPYSKYPDGLGWAYIHAAQLAGKLLRAGVRIYSPITHTHPIAIHGEIDPLDHSFWMPFNYAIMPACDALCVAKMNGWKDSDGIGEEIRLFREVKKPIFYLEPQTMELSS